MSVQTHISLAWQQLRRQRRLKLGSLLNDHEIFNWLTSVYARGVRSSPTSIARKLTSDLKVVNDLRKPFSLLFQWRLWKMHVNSSNEATRTGNGTMCAPRYAIPHTTTPPQSCMLCGLILSFNFSFYDRCTQFSEYLSLHVEIDVIFLTTTSPRWVATVQSVLPFVLQFKTQLKFCISERQASFQLPVLETHERAWSRFSFGSALRWGTPFCFHMYTVWGGRLFEKLSCWFFEAYLLRLGAISYDSGYL